MGNKHHNAEDNEAQDQEADESKQDKLVKKAKLPTSPEEEKKALAQIWNKKELIRKTFAPNLNSADFRMFLGMGKMLGANPFKKEIYPAKIKGKMQVLVARDFYRRKAQEQPSYDGHRVYAVYENDDFKLVNGEPQHSVDSFADRGKLKGAYAMGWRKDVNNHFYESVLLEEYDRGNYIWSGKPETMIKKVAEAHLLRLMYAGILENTYIPEEMPKHDKPQVEIEEDDESTEAVIIGEE